MSSPIHISKVVRSGIPTRAQGVNFRSRVEARWAEFFTLMGWGWTYEPFDLNGYIPDFALEFHEPLLVEIKGPFEDIAVARSKIECSGWDGEALVVAGAWPKVTWHESMPTIGSLCERSDGPDGERPFHWDNAVLFECLHCRRMSLLHQQLTWRCRVNGCWDGNSYIGGCHSVNPREAWNEAGNKTQWRAV